MKHYELCAWRPAQGQRITAFNEAVGGKRLSFWKVDVTERVIKPQSVLCLPHSPPYIGIYFGGRVLVFGDDTRVFVMPFTRLVLTFKSASHSCDIILSL